MHAPDLVAAGPRRSGSPGMPAPPPPLICHHKAGGAARSSAAAAAALPPASVAAAAAAPCPWAPLWAAPPCLCGSGPPRCWWLLLPPPAAAAAAAAAPALVTQATQAVAQKWGHAEEWPSAACQGHTWLLQGTRHWGLGARQPPPLPASPPAP
eukprot:1161096-Pelagomonas_calceolata.AAC.5